MLAVLLAALEGEEDRSLLIELYKKYHEEMEQCAIHILREQHDAEDAVQSAFVQIIRHFEKARGIPRGELPFWLIAIVKNESLILLRKRKDFVDLERVDDFAWQADCALGYQELVALFRKLPETYRGVLEMKMLLGYSDSEIAARFGISETAVSTRVSRGRALLREIVQKEGFCL